MHDFDARRVLDKPLMAHLATTDKGEPRDSPVWFLWEEEALWIFGTRQDSFIRRLRENPQCAVGVVDFDLDKGVLRHVGIRGTSRLGPVDKERLTRFVSKYLGSDQKAWNTWFTDHIVNPLDQMVEVSPQSIVAKDVSFFKTGPDLAD